LTTVPETKYVRNGDVHLAYQTLGTGPRDLLFVTLGPASHIENFWEEPAVARATLRTATYGRFTLFDNRGVGLSDPIPPGTVPTIDQQLDDIRAILDEVGAGRATLIGYVAGCALAMLFAARYPERVESLILWIPYARLLIDDDYPIGVPPEFVEQVVAGTLEGWGKGTLSLMVSPSMAEDKRFNAWGAQMERLAASPGTAAALVRQWFDIDVRSVLPAIRVPTLVLGRTDQPLIAVAHTRYVAERIVGATYVESKGSDLHYFLGETEPFFQALDDFLGADHPQAELDRFLGTVLFTDIAGSTELAGRIGDTRFRDLLESHRRLLARQLDRYRGRLMDTAGDGALALFDSPARAIACAEAIRDGVRALGIEVRAGLHTGEIEQRADGGIGGIAVHIGARVSALARPGEILVSRTIKDLIAGSSVGLVSRGVHQLKGVSDSWEVFAVQ
jgi:class 3 adenylate cyclase/pimeloyl-ACP methyl ester carboxylesterase